MKDLFIQAHEELVEKYLEEHPGADWSDAYEATSDVAYLRMQDKLADKADFERARRKEGEE